MKSKLGWLVSGPIFGIPQPISNVNMIVSETLEDSIEDDTLRELLNRFWETEAIGIQAESNIPAINGDTFLKDVKYEKEPTMKSHYLGSMIALTCAATLTSVTIDSGIYNDDF